MYVVYHIASTQAIKWFDTAAGAKRSRTCSNRNAGKEAYAYTDAETYRAKIVTKKVVKNLMSGKDVVIDSNTPLCCDPSSETYHSM
jgi:hypothetical protein